MVELKLVRHCPALLRLHRNQNFIYVYILDFLWVKENTKEKKKKKPETLGRWTTPNRTKEKPLLRIVVLCFCCSCCCCCCCWVCVLFFEERERVRENSVGKSKRTYYICLCPSDFDSKKVCGTDKTATWVTARGPTKWRT